MEIVLPKNSLTMTEAEIIAWHAEEGQPVEAGDLLFTMETSKSQVDIEAPASGTLTRILRQPGDVVPAGDVIAILEVAGEPTATTGQGLAAPVSASRMVSATAAALAADLGVDIDTVRGSGPGGRVLEEDVIRASQAQRPANPPAAPSAPAAPSGPGATGPAPPQPAPPPTGLSAPKSAGPGGPRHVVPASMSKARRAGLRLTEEMASVPVFQLAGDLDFAPVREAMAAEGVSVSDVLLVACAQALDAVPIANACLHQGEVHRYAEKRIGLLVRNQDALVPLVFPEPARQPLAELHRRRRDLMDQLEKGAVPVDATSWPTFVISNIGRPGVVWFSAVLFPGTAATLAVGSLSDDHTVRAVLTCDHRILDGVDAAELMSALRAAVASFDTKGAAVR
jgi:pyruvate dehydrogenase E2 component (dihydrolipoamide acetyltransferase)